MLQEGTCKIVCGVRVIVRTVVDLLGGTIDAKGEMLEARVSDCSPVLLEFCRAFAVAGPKRQTSSKLKDKFVVVALNYLRFRLDRGNSLDCAHVSGSAAICLRFSLHHGGSERLVCRLAQVQLATQARKTSKRTGDRSWGLMQRYK